MGVRSANKFRRKKLKPLPDFSSLRDNHVRVGLPSDIIHEPSGLTLAQIGTVHEFGSSDGRVPARKPLRLFAINAKNEARRMFLDAARRVARGRDGMTELEAIAAWSEVRAQQSYIDVDSPPLADRTLRRKVGKAKTTAKAEAELAAAGEDTLNNPLIDTGEMKNSVTAQVQRND